MPTVQLDDGTIEVCGQLVERRPIDLGANPDHNVCQEIEGQKSNA